MGTEWVAMEKEQSQALKVALAAFAPKLEYLLQVRKLTQPEVARQLKRRGTTVSTKTINNIVHAKHSPEVGNMAALADFLAVPLWVMLIPSLPMEMLQGDLLKRLDKMIQDYIACDPEGRMHTENVAAAHVKPKVK